MIAFPKKFLSLATFGWFSFCWTSNLPSPQISDTASNSSILESTRTPICPQIIIDSTSSNPECFSLNNVNQPIGNISQSSLQNNNPKFVVPGVTFNSAPIQFECPGVSTFGTEPEDGVSILMKILEESKSYSCFRILKFPGMYRYEEIISDYFKNRPFTFVFTPFTGIINTGEPITIDPSSLTPSYELYCESNKIDNILSSIKFIPDKTLVDFTIYHEKMEELIEQPNAVLSKVRPYFAMKSCGNLNIDLFENFYLRFQGALKQNLVSHSEYLGNLRLFTTPEKGSRHEDLFKISFIKSNYNTIYLNLSNLCTNCNNYEIKQIDYSKKGQFTGIRLDVDETIGLAPLSQVLENNQISLLNCCLQSAQSSYNHLFNIIKNQKFNSLTIRSYYPESAQIQNFINNLAMLKSFWTDLEYLHLSNFSFETIFHLLQNNSFSKLEKLELLDCSYGNFNGSFDRQLKFDSVKELSIHFGYSSDSQKCKKNVEDFLEMFPNVEKVTLNLNEKLVNIELTKCEKLKEIYLSCLSLENERKFICQLINTPQLVAVSVVQYLDSEYEWKKENDHIYYKFFIKYPFFKKQANIK